MTEKSEIAPENAASSPARAPLPEGVKEAGKAVWILLLVRGILSVLFGIAALLSPVATILVLTVVFGVYTLADGLVGIFQTVQHFRERQRSRWILLFQAVLSIVVGIIVLTFPIDSGFILGLYVAFTLAVYTISQAAIAFSAPNNPQAGSRRIWAGVAAALSIVFSIALIIAAFVAPFEVIAALIWVLGIYAIIFGASLIAAAFQVRSALKNNS